MRTFFQRDDLTYRILTRDEVAALPLDDYYRSWFDYWDRLHQDRRIDFGAGRSVDIPYFALWLQICWSPSGRYHDVVPLDSPVSYELQQDMRREGYGDYRNLESLRRAWYQ